MAVSAAKYASREPTRAAPKTAAARSAGTATAA